MKDMSEEMADLKTGLPATFNLFKKGGI